jgi:hypothetical protein
MFARLGLGPRQKPMRTITVEPNEGNNCGEDSFDGFDSNIHSCIILNDPMLMLDTVLQFAFNRETQKYIVYFTNSTDEYTIVRYIIYEGGEYGTDFDEITKEYDDYEVKARIRNFTFFKKLINRKNSKTHMKLFTRSSNSKDVEAIKNYISEREVAEQEMIEYRRDRREKEQRVMDIDSIHKEYGDSLVEVNFTSYTQLGITFSVFRVTLITESNNTERYHYFVCITYKSDVTNDKRVALTRYGIKEYSILKYFTVNNGPNIYLNESDKKACTSNVTEFIKKLKALPEQEPEYDSNKSITLFLIEPNAVGLVELQNMKGEAPAQTQTQGTRGESETTGETGRSPEESVSTTKGGRVRVRPFISSLIKRRKSINRRKSIKRRKPRKKRRVTKKKKEAKLI